MASARTEAQYPGVAPGRRNLAVVFWTSRRNLSLTTGDSFTTGASLRGVSGDVEKEGTGTITVEDKGKTGKVSFKGKTKDNVGLEGTIDCQQLMRSE